MTTGRIYYCGDNDTYYTEADLLQFYAEYISEEAENNDISISAMKAEVSYADYLHDATGKNGSLTMIEVNEYTSRRIAELVCFHIRASIYHVKSLLDNADPAFESYISVLLDLYDWDADSDITSRNMDKIASYWEAIKLLNGK